MSILSKGMTVHCLFEQSGTFKQQFIELGFNSRDYDICNDFGETDCIVDLFKEINAAYIHRSSIFKGWGKNDFVFAFFPCTYFNQANRILLRLDGYPGKDFSIAIPLIIKRARNVYNYYVTLNRLLSISLRQGFPMVIENPCVGSLIASTFYKKPDICDSNRAELGDAFRKPTYYWFVNCKPAGSLENCGYKAVTPSSHILSSHGISRSIMSSEYARNFIRVALLGEDKNPNQLTLWST